jgi:tellurite resistance protein TerB
MSGVLGSLITKYSTRLERQKNRPFLEGVMAACALVASADGEISFGERVRVDQILQTLEKLQVFDPHEGVDLFNEFTDLILEHPATGHETAFLAMEKVAREPETGALMVRICVAVSEASGGDRIADQIEIVTLCSRLGLDPSECGLYVDNPAGPIIG